MNYPEIKYTKGWKYVLNEHTIIETGIFSDRVIIHKDEFILFKDGTLHIFKGYPWDGASGGIDTKNSMVASLVHDCFCEMTRTKELDYEQYAPLMHELLAKIAKSKGMSGIRASGWEWATKTFRGGHPSHPDVHPVLTA